MRRLRATLSAVAFVALLGAGASGQDAEDVSTDRVGRDMIAPDVMNTVTRGRRGSAADAEKRGMIPTGLTAIFEAGAKCPTVDDGWAMDYSEKRGREARHGGIDIVAPRGTPIRAVADSVVIGIFPNKKNAKGIEIMLRHRPEDTGLPYWIYTQYTHLMELPERTPGQRVRMGDVIGLTGTGAEARRRGGDGGGGGRNKRGDKIRRDAVHFAVLYSTSRKFMKGRRFVIPQDGYWMDPHALYRKAESHDSQSLAALPDTEKRIAVPYMLDGGATVPATTRLIWPYACGAR